MIDAPEEGYEVFYRKLSSAEADSIMASSGIMCQKTPIKRNNILHSSNGNKWISSSPTRVAKFRPKDGSDEDYTDIIAFYVVPGTKDALIKLRQENKVKRGATGAYGIPPKYIPWFNNRILCVDRYSIKDKDKLAKTSDQPCYLADKDSAVIFQAYSMEYILNDGFSRSIKHNRMTWLKTSLMWMLYRSDWGRKESQERIVQIKVPNDYLKHLNEKAIPTKHPDSKLADIIYQNDPNRRIFGQKWVEGSQNYWLKSNTTKHFGIRGKAISEFIYDIVPGNLTDITDVLQNIERERPEHPRMTLYQTFNIRQLPLSCL